MTQDAAKRAKGRPQAGGWEMSVTERAKLLGWKTPREVAQRIAELHPPVDAEMLTTKDKVMWVGRWKADHCPQWIAEITAIIAARDADIAEDRPTR